MLLDRDGRIKIIDLGLGNFWNGKDLLGTLAVEIGKLPNKVTMEGHTDSKPFNGRADYSNWELSSDRANAARRWMHDHGMQDDQVTQVRGFADQSPREATKPEDPSNRRVTLIIQYQKQTPNLPPEPKAGASAPAGKPSPAPKPPAPAH